MKEDQRKEACESLQQIEERLVDRVLRAYEKMNMTEFWTLIQGLNQFLDAKRKICE